MLIGTATSGPFRVVWNKPNPGTYFITAQARDDSNQTTTSDPIVVTINQPLNLPATISLTSPAPGTVFAPTASIPLAAAATDPDGIARVDFFAGNEPIGSAATAPYSILWNNVKVGSYVVNATAVDILGQSTPAAPVTISVSGTPPPSNAPPSVSITVPADASTFVGPTNLTITASAADLDGTIARVDFFQGSTLLGGSATAPFTIVWPNALPGKYVLTALATDNTGAKTTSSPVNIAINAPPNVPPVVALTAPLDHATFTAPASIQLTAAASDADGTIQKVDFFQGATLLGSSTAAPFTFMWTNALFGAYTLTAAATDNTGSKTTSAPVSIIISAPPNVPPVVALIAPSDHATFTEPASIQLTATASDSDGTVQQVAFFQGTNPLGTVTNAPFTLLWSNVLAGAYVLSATATDDRSTTSTSASVTIDVAPQAPLIINAQLIGNSIQLSWSGIAILESANSALGLWLPVPGATNSPQTIVADQGAKFFRLSR